MKLLVAALVLARVGVADADDRKPIPPYPHARQLCHEHVAGNSMHIDWTSSATPDSVDQVLAFYSRFGKPAQSVIEVDADRRIEVAATSAAASLPSCATTATEREHTIIVISMAIR